MMEFIRMIRKVTGDRIKSLILPVALSCVDSLLHMGMFVVMIVTVIELLNNVFSPQKLLIYSGALLALFLIRAVLYSITYTQTQFRGADITAHLRLSIGNHIRSLNLGYFNKNSIGQLASTLTTDISDFEQVLTHSLSSIFKVLFFSILALLFAFAISWQYALLLSALIVVAFPLMRLSGKVSKKNGERLRVSINDVISRIVEYINGIKTFKLYNLTGERFSRLDDSFVKLKKDSVRLELSIMPFSISFSIITSLMIPVALIAGTIMFQNGGLDAQNTIAVIMVALSLSSMMATLGSLYPEMTYLGKAADNILRVQAERPLEYREGVEPSGQFGIRFDNVDFCYTENVEVLRAVSFETRPGTVTALVGPSGSGKTTIVSLISRFWDVSGGSISIDGRNIKTIAPDRLTSHMSVVFQEVYLLNDTITNNIRVGKPDATIEEVQVVTKATQCHDFIMAFPDGYDTLVGEGGSTLSGGEKQRISIARALIKDTPIVLLDESTSSLDADNELEINRALDTLMQNKTVIVIAHRLNTIMNADNILVLDKGVIKEQGTHRELIHQGGWYARMIQEQKKARNWAV